MELVVWLSRHVPNQPMSRQYQQARVLECHEYRENVVERLRRLCWRLLRSPLVAVCKGRFVTMVAIRDPDPLWSQQPGNRIDRARVIDPQNPVHVLADIGGYLIGSLRCTHRAGE